MDTSFPGITDKALKSLATKVNASTDYFKTKKLLRKATGEDNGKAMDLGWHLLGTRLVPAETSTSLLLALESDGMNVARAQALADFLVRLPEGTTGELWPGWTWVLDAFAYQGYGLAPEAFEARFAELPRAARLGIVFVRARREQRPSLQDGLEVMAELARAQATGYGITGNAEMPYWRASDEVAHRLSDVAALRSVALLLGTEADWDRLLLEATRARAWGLIENISPALEQMPLDELAAHFVAREKANQRVFGDSSTAEESARNVFARRQDDPAALRKAAKSSPDLKKLLA